MFAGSTRAPLQIHVGMGIKKACASVLGTNLVEVRLGVGSGGGIVVALTRIMESNSLFVWLSICVWLLFN